MSLRDPGSPSRPSPSRRSHRRRLTVALALAALTLTGSVLAGCGDDPPDRPDSPNAPRSPGVVATPPGNGVGVPTPAGSAGFGGSGSPSARPSVSASGPRRPAAWRHRPGLSWQWQLTGEVDTGVDADVYELDGFTTPASTVARLRAANRRTICYVSAGAYEDFRPDADRFPASVLGRGNGWPGERWLDIRRWQTLEPILRARFTMCRDKGFEAVEADNVDGYANQSGFPLRGSDQLVFNRGLARLAHSLGLAIALKNDLDQVAALEPDFDFAVNESCFEYEECERLAPFLRAGKPVFHVEYGIAPERFCARVSALGLTSMAKRPDLDAWRSAC